MTSSLSTEALDQLFRSARSRNDWTAETLPESTWRDLYDLLKFGPTSANLSPARFVFVTTDEGKRELASLRSALAEGAEKLAAKAGGAGAKAPDFAAAAASVDPAVLSVLKNAYSGLKLPALDPAASVKAVEEKFGPIVAAAKELDAASATRLAALQKEAAALEADISKLRSSTIDEELAADPKTAKEIDAEISAGSFY